MNAVLRNVVWPNVVWLNVVLWMVSSARGALMPSGPVTVSGQTGVVIENRKITSTTGDCVTITNSQNITLRNSEIGPCGTSGGSHRGISITGGSDIQIYDNYIHPEFQAPTCCDTGDGIYAAGTTRLTIQGNVIAYSESNIEVSAVTTVRVIGNFLLNPLGAFPRGQNFQSGDNSSDILVDSNYTLASSDLTRYKMAAHQEDSFNFGLSNGIIARTNYVTGGQSASGCGFTADDRADNAQFLNNTLVDTGQCGIGLADGINGLVDGNRVLNRNPISGAGNTAIFAWKQSASACGPTQVTNNIATEVRSDGTQSGFWNGGGCDPLTETGNTWDEAARLALEPVGVKYPPPLIPPKPFACATQSPYTTQTGWPACEGGISPPPPGPDPVSWHLHFDRFLKLGGQLTLDYATALGVQQVEWIFTPTSNSSSLAATFSSSFPAVTGGEPIKGKMGPRQGQSGVTANAGAATFKVQGSNTLQLTSDQLSPGDYQLTVILHGAEGAIIAQDSQNVTLVLGNLSAVKVYPNPWRSEKHAGHPSIIFDGVTVGTTIKLFTVSGHEVKELHTDGPKVPWDLTNDSGDKVASGVYLYVITDTAGGKVKGKVAVMK